DPREAAEVSHRDHVEGFAVVEFQVPVHRRRLLPAFSDVSLAETKCFTRPFESPCDWREFGLFTVAPIGGRQSALGQVTLFAKPHRFLAYLASTRFPAPRWARKVYFPVPDQVNSCSSPDL